jgi:CheY-like chemotaxis protein
MVYGFAQRSKGDAQIVSELGVGTRIDLHLPRATVADREELEGVAPADVRHGGETILVVDDESELRTVVRDHLNAFGYETLEAENGPQALEILRRDPSIDLMLTDVVMPGGMSGDVLAREARAVRPDLKVVLTTGYPRGMGQEPGGGTAPWPMLRKPFTRQELGRLVRETLDAPSDGAMRKSGPRRQGKRKERHLAHDS